MSVHGIVLAGGLGTRLGLGVPKARVELAGVSLLARALAALAPVCGRVSIVAPPGIAALLADEARGRPIDHDAPGGAGPLAGLVAGLEAASRDAAEHAVVLAVDLPFVRPATLDALLALARRGSTLAALPAEGGIPQPLAAVYAVDAAPALAAAFAAGVTSVTEAVCALPHRLVPAEELPGGAGAFFNLNTAEDLAEAERRIGMEGAREGER